MFSTWSEHALRTLPTSSQKELSMRKRTTCFFWSDKKCFKPHIFNVQKKRQLNWKQSHTLKSKPSMNRWQFKICQKNKNDFLKFYEFSPAFFPWFRDFLGYVPSQHGLTDTTRPALFGSARIAQASPSSSLAAASASAGAFGADAPPGEGGWSDRKPICI